MESAYLIFKINYLSAFNWLIKALFPSWVDADRHFFLER